MELQFTRNVGERFKSGDVRDYPRSVWEQIARSAGQKLDKFTRSAVQPIDEKRRMVAREDAHVQA